MPRGETIDAPVTTPPESIDPPRGRFNLSHAMLLVAAVAPGLLLLRFGAGLGLFKVDPNVRASPAREYVAYLVVAGGCILLPLAIAVLAMCLGRRPTRRAALQGAGCIACVSVAVAAILPIAYFAVAVSVANELSRPSAISLNFNNSFARLSQTAGMMIAGAWLALALTGRWRLGPGWMDRLGVFVGACFVSLYLSSNVFYLLHPLLAR